MSSSQTALDLVKMGVVEVIQERELLQKLERGKPLRIKAGFDPTASDLHLGHTVILQKLKQWQELGHQIIFLIGDFTAMIGDPSGKSETRPAISEADIKRNVKTYEEQVYKVLDRNKTQIVYNSAWLSKLSSKEFIHLASCQTVARMLERDDFENRYRKGDPISLHEFLYPLLQGYDSVQIHADVEIGGTDQKFNLLVGRDSQRFFHQEPQVVMTLPLLVGTDGVQKMSKSFGNVIRLLDQPFDMVGQIMSLSDSVMWLYYELLSSKSAVEVTSLKQSVESGEGHPMKVKKELAREIVSRYHGEKRADEAIQEFERVFSRKENPSHMDEVSLSGGGRGLALVEVLSLADLTSSKSEARRLILQNAVSVDEKKVIDPAHFLAKGKHNLKVGKRKFKSVNIH